MHNRRAFTLIELIAVIVVLAILAGVGIPAAFDHRARAQTSALQGLLSSVREGIRNACAANGASGTPRYPTHAEILNGTYLMQDSTSFPLEPFSATRTLNLLSGGSDPVAQPVTGTGGWNYWIDNTTTPTACRFWADSSATTTKPKPGGGFYSANEL